ncbi:MAG: hypothetical protein Q9186_005570 [Xanthomendoza sp. 1 TL-2023]
MNAAKLMPVREALELELRFEKIPSFLNSSPKVIDHALPPSDVDFPALLSVIRAARESRPAFAYRPFHLFVFSAHDIQLGEYSDQSDLIFPMKKAEQRLVEAISKLVSSPGNRIDPTSMHASFLESTSIVRVNVCTLNRL